MSRSRATVALSNALLLALVSITGSACSSSSSPCVHDIDCPGSMICIQGLCTSCVQDECLSPDGGSDSVIDQNLDEGEVITDGSDAGMDDESAAAEGETECMPPQQRPCGKKCGHNVCQQNGIWETACEGEGECDAGTTLGCGNCGSKSCDASSCVWSACSGEHGCAPTTTQKCGTGNCGTQTCLSDCSWGQCGGGNPVEVCDQCPTGVCRDYLTSQDDPGCGCASSVAAPNCNLGVTYSVYCGWGSVYCYYERREETQECNCHYHCQ